MQTEDTKIRLGSYPYVNARVRAMRAKLLTSNDYRKLRKMTVSEILEFLQKQDYQDEINQYGGDYEGEELLEIALNQNLANTYQKLLDISPDQIQRLLRAYFQKFDMQNLKTIIRHRLRESDETVEEMLLPTQDFTEKELQDLMAKQSIEELLGAIRLRNGKRLLDMVDDPTDLRQIEDALDQYYYSHLIQIARQIPSQGELFRKFLQLEAELLNVNLILRMKKHGYDRSDIEDHLLDLPRGFRSLRHDALLDASSYENAVDLLEEEKLGRYIENHDIAQVERALDRYKIEQGVLMLHQEPLSINPVLGYMISKEAEIENLRIILQANKAGLGEEFIEQNVIFEVRER